MNLIIKLTGAVLFVVTSSLYGWMKARDLWMRRQELKYLIQMMTLLKNEVTYRRSSLGETFLEVSEECREPYCDIFSGIYQKMEYDRCSFHNAWREALEDMISATCLQKEDVHCMTGLTGLARAMNGQLQEEVFGQIGSRMEDQMERLEEDYRQKGRVYCCMGITIGILGVIILV